jgi:hypothetical protein
MREGAWTALFENGAEVVVTASVARLAAADSRFRQFLHRTLRNHREEVCSRLFLTYTQAGFPGIAMIREPMGLGGRMTVALAGEY